MFYNSGLFDIQSEGLIICTYWFYFDSDFDWNFYILQISGLVANSNIITSKTGAIANNYVSHLLRGSTLVLPSSTSGQSSSNIQSLICVTIANSNLAQLNQSGLIRSQSNASNVRVLSLPTKVLIPEQQHPQKNILIGQPVSQTLVNPPAIYLANLHGKPIQDSIKSLPTSSIINTSNISLTKSLNTVPRGINPSISLLSPTDVRVAIMRPKAGQDHSPQVLQARLPTSLQGFFQIVSRPQLPTQTTTSKWSILGMAAIDRCDRLCYLLFDLHLTKIWNNKYKS